MRDQAHIGSRNKALTDVTNQGRPDRCIHAPVGLRRGNTHHRLSCPPKEGRDEKFVGFNLAPPNGFPRQCPPFLHVGKDSRGHGKCHHAWPLHCTYTPTRGIEPAPRPEICRRTSTHGRQVLYDDLMSPTTIHKSGCGRLNG